MRSRISPRNWAEEPSLICSGSENGVRAKKMISDTDVRLLFFVRVIPIDWRIASPAPKRIADPFIEFKTDLEAQQTRSVVCVFLHDFRVESTGHIIVHGEFNELGTSQNPIEREFQTWNILL
jgi:hypothetical protein